MDDDEYSEQLQKIQHLFLSGSEPDVALTVSV